MTQRTEFEVLKVGLKNRSYEIFIGSDLTKRAGELILPLLKRKRVTIVTDNFVGSSYMRELESSLRECGVLVDCLILEPGEASKSWKTLEQVVEWLIEKKIERDDFIIAFGGGVIGDIVGFASSIVRRGVSMIQFPTTLLAQVDSAVGGKTGINSRYGKNLIGTFHQPKLVVSDISVLGSLSERNWLSGYSEVVKYGLIGDRDFFMWLEKNSSNILNGDSEKIKYAVKRSCEIKASVVARDEREKSSRALLNLGHTFGHALEAFTGYSDKLIHGEAVCLGCVLAFRLSNRMALCTDEDVCRVENHYKKNGMKIEISDFDMKTINAKKILQLMSQDKKTKDGLLNLILVKGIGKAFVAKNFDIDILESFLVDQINC